MDKILHVLIIDDHSMIIEGYKSIILNIPFLELEVREANSCEEAHTIITTAKHPFDIIILDINLPPFEKAKLFSGEDIAVLIRKHWPESKIIIVTSNTESILLFNIIKRINPEGVLVKSDFLPAEFANAFVEIVEGHQVYTAAADRSLKNVYIDNNYLDAYNRRIISLLAKGIATKSLPIHLNITISAIDKRKASIKEFFNIRKGNDEDIIREAKKHGLI